jgi:guanylate kinase
LQRLDALKIANTVRQQRAELKQSLRRGEMSIVELLVTPPEFLLTARLSQILLAAPGYGQVRVSRLLKRCRISPLKTIGTLSERQRHELTQALSVV